MPIGPHTLEPPKTARFEFLSSLYSSQDTFYKLVTKNVYQVNFLERGLKNILYTGNFFIASLYPCCASVIESFE